jgi:hypothetical protein
MGKPFKVETAPSPTDIGRMPDGKFVRVVPPPPGELLKQAAAKGQDALDAVAANRAGMHATPGGTRGAEIPWGPGGAHSDAAKPPMKLDG